MANMPHPDKQAVTWRIHRSLVDRVKDAADRQGETAVAFVVRALENELDLSEDGGAVITTSTGRPEPLGEDPPRTVERVSAHVPKGRRDQYRKRTEQGRPGNPPPPEP